MPSLFTDALYVLHSENLTHQKAHLITRAKIALFLPVLTRPTAVPGDARQYSPRTCLLSLRFTSFYCPSHR